MQNPRQIRESNEQSEVETSHSAIDHFSIDSVERNPREVPVHSERHVGSCVDKHVRPGSGISSSYWEETYETENEPASQEVIQQVGEVETGEGIPSLARVACKCG